MSDDQQTVNQEQPAAAPAEGNEFYQPINETETQPAQEAIPGTEPVSEATPTSDAVPGVDSAPEETSPSYPAGQLGRGDNTPVDPTITNPNVGHDILGNVAQKGLIPPRTTTVLQAGPVETINSGVELDEGNIQSPGLERNSVNQQTWAAGGIAGGGTAQGGIVYDLKNDVAELEERIEALEQKEYSRSAGKIEGEDEHPLDKPEHHWLRDLLAQHGIRPAQ